MHVCICIYTVVVLEHTIHAIASEMNMMSILKCFIVENRRAITTECLQGFALLALEDFHGEITRAIGQGEKVTHPHRCRIGDLIESNISQLKYKWLYKK